MKSTIFILLLTLLSSAAVAQDDAITRYFDNYLDDERFTVVYISPMMFKMVAALDTGEVNRDMREIISDLSGLRILISETNTLDLYEEAASIIKTKAYDPILMLREGAGEQVQFLVKQERDTISELLMLIGSPDNFVFMSFTGLIDLARIGTLAESLDIKGLEHLKQVGTKKTNTGN